ncbi:MAG: peroxisomal biogenesis factor 11 [Piptocephalis tieghemiana]|nr:MAG: peroxisomal biogenesis factor 11 [Piptocephalis tieghemiana]
MASIGKTYTTTIQPYSKYGATTVGRDKFYRAVQYGARALAYYAATYTNTSPETIKRLTALKAAIGQARKLMRVGKPLDHLQSLVSSTQQPDDFLRLAGILRYASLAAYLTFDMLQWIHSAGAYKFSNIKAYSRRASKFWLLGILFSWISGLYRLRALRIRGISLKRAQGDKAPESLSPVMRKEGEALVKERREVETQLLQDSLDALIPASALEYIRISDGLVGLAGFYTSLMGMRSQWRKVVVA